VSQENNYTDASKYATPCISLRKWQVMKVFKKERWGK